ncbi:MAG: 50S ribosomal protein L24 [Deltaproteobacteria bacterium]|nr:50S ribosomal protein L24 [Deltaproteobacteria bacterium]
MGLKKNDDVMVLTGKEKGKTGKIIRIDKNGIRVYIKKVNMIKRHIKPRSPQEPGGIIDKEAGINISNVGLYCSKCKKPVRFSVKANEKNKKIRICKKCGSEV